MNGNYFGCTIKLNKHALNIHSAESKYFDKRKDARRSNMQGQNQDQYLSRSELLLLL